MKVVNVLGSPRKNGTSARIAKAFTDEAEKLGAKVESYYLNGMKYRGCQGCEQCHSKSNKCILKDDLRNVLEALHSSDIAIFSSPVYYGSVSGQFKMFFDRTWSLVNINYENEIPYSTRLAGGKTAIFLLSQGDIAEKHLDIIERYTPFFELYGYDLKVIRATGLMTGDPAADVSDSQVEMKDLARNLFNTNSR